MTATYVPVKGDRIRRNYWDSTEYIDVDYVGRTVIVGTDKDGDEVTQSHHGTWIKVETPTPLPEGWINYYSNGLTATHSSKVRADAFAGDTRIAVVNIWTDADGVDRIERVTP